MGGSVLYISSTDQDRKNSKKRITHYKKKAMNNSLKTLFSLLMLVSLTSAAGLRPKQYNLGPLPASLLQMDEDYDDFSEVPKILRYAYNLPVRDEKLVEVLLPPKKRHLGIDIPDYIASSFGKSEALKEMSNKMKSLGKK